MWVAVYRLMSKTQITKVIEVGDEKQAKKWESSEVGGIESEWHVEKLLNCIQENIFWRKTKESHVNFDLKILITKSIASKNGSENAHMLWIM